MEERYLTLFSTHVNCVWPQEAYADIHTEHQATAHIQTNRTTAMHGSSEHTGHANFVLHAPTLLLEKSSGEQ